MRILTGTIDKVRVAVAVDKNRLSGVYAQINDDRPWTGDSYGASIMRYAPAQRAYFIDIGNGHQGFLPHADAGAFSPGVKLAVKIERAATPTKQTRCSLLDGAADKVGCIQRGPDVTALAMTEFPQASVEKDPRVFDDYATLVTDLLQPEVIIQEGISIVIEETAALTAIDVNNAAPNILPLAVNKLAANEVVRQIGLRNLGGQMVVDFLRLRDSDTRRQLEVELQQLSAGKGIDLYGFTKLGLFELVRKRNGLSLGQVFNL
jgi:Ribonuclease G/E